MGFAAGHLQPFVRRMQHARSMLESRLTHAFERLNS